MRADPATRPSTPRRSVDAPATNRRRRPSRRPWFAWVLTALAFPPAGYVGHVVAGRVDSVAAALLGGLVTGAGIGAGQWVLLRRRGVSRLWVVATAAGLAVGLAVGAALVSYATDRPALALMGAIAGGVVGVAQGATLGDPMRAVLWGGATAILWAGAWTTTAAFGIDVEQQWVVFGISGAAACTFLQSLVIGHFIPAGDRAGSARSTRQSAHRTAINAGVTP